MSQWDCSCDGEIDPYCPQHAPGVDLTKIPEPYQVSIPDSWKIVAYKLHRSAGIGWMFAGTTPEQVAMCLKHELENHGLVDESITIECYETTPAEIEDLPEFQGW